MIDCANSLNESFHCYALNEEAVTLIFGNSINPETARSIQRFQDKLQKNTFPGFRTAVPAYCSLTVYFDVYQVFQSGLKGNNAFDKVSRHLDDLHNIQHNSVPEQSSIVSIPVCYDGLLGPDLGFVAAYTGFSIPELIKLHSEALYRVYMIGFLPGFAYLGGMDERLDSPRKLQPRQQVPQGSVGIAGLQTGVYPLESPGGWQIIGRSPLRFFDPAQAQPALLKAGDQVRFEPISIQEFNRMVRT